MTTQAQAREVMPMHAGYRMLGIARINMRRPNSDIRRPFKIGRHPILQAPDSAAFIEQKAGEVESVHPPSARPLRQVVAAHQSSACSDCSMHWVLSTMRCVQSMHGV